MKYSILALVAIFAVGGYALADNEPKLVEGQFLTGYIPDGFDSNDKVQVTSEGYFPNTCYRVASYESKVDKSTKTISIKPLAYKYNAMCLQMLVPYYQVIDVGILEAGSYTVKDASSEKTLGNLNVKIATSSSPDDFLYAPVAQARIENRTDGKYVAINGEFTNSCIEFKQMKVDVQKNVIVVLPITEAADRLDCKDGKFPYAQAIKLEGAFSGRYLLHVRTLNGNAVNQLVDIN
jgi:hypothetical protein